MLNFKLINNCWLKKLIEIVKRETKKNKDIILMPF